jgi:hypothetical protein
MRRAFCAMLTVSCLLLGVGGALADQAPPAAAPKAAPSAAPKVAPPSAPASATVLDGNFWRQMTTDQKSLFLYGYAMGVDFLSKFASGPCDSCKADCLEGAAQKLVPIGTAIPQIVAAVDKIYEDESNRGILVFWAFKLAALKSRGVSDADWKAALEEARPASGEKSP